MWAEILDVLGMYLYACRTKVPVDCVKKSEVGRHLFWGRKVEGVLSEKIRLREAPR
jgi:hypothetical protein